MDYYKYPLALLLKKIILYLHGNNISWPQTSTICVLEATTFDKKQKYCICTEGTNDCCSPRLDQSISSIKLGQYMLSTFKLNNTEGLFTYYVIILWKSQADFCDQRSPQLVVAVGHNIFEVTLRHFKNMLNLEYFDNIFRNYKKLFIRHNLSISANFSNFWVFFN